VKHKANQKLAIHCITIQRLKQQPYAINLHKNVYRKLQQEKRYA